MTGKPLLYVVFAFVMAACAPVAFAANEPVLFANPLPANPDESQRPEDIRGIWRIERGAEVMLIADSVLLMNISRGDGATFIPTFRTDGDKRYANAKVIALPAMESKSDVRVAELLWEKNLVVMFKLSDDSLKFGVFTECDRLKEAVAAGVLAMAPATPGAERDLLKTVSSDSEAIADFFRQADGDEFTEMTTWRLVTSKDKELLSRIRNAMMKKTLGKYSEMDVQAMLDDLLRASARFRGEKNAINSFLNTWNSSAAATGK